MTARRSGAVVFSAVTLVARFATAQSAATDVPAANPGRPTVSTPATLTPLAYVQFETGSVAARHFGDLATQVAVNEVAKVTVHPRAQLLFQAEPFARSRVAEAPVDLSAGGTAAGVQVVVVDGKSTKPTLAVSYFHSLSDGSAPDLDIGSAKQSGLVLLSANLAGLHVDTNAIFNQQTDGDDSRVQHGQTFCVSRAVAGVTIAGELWHFTQPLAGGHAAGLLWAASYAIRPNLVLDAGFNRGLTDTSARWEFFAGFTYVPAHPLWKSR